MNFEAVFGQLRPVMRPVIAALMWWDRGEDREEEKRDLSPHICCRFAEGKQCVAALKKCLPWVDGSWDELLLLPGPATADVMDFLRTSSLSGRLQTMSGFWSGFALECSPNTSY